VLLQAQDVPAVTAGQEAMIPGYVHWAEEAKALGVPVYREAMKPTNESVVLPLITVTLAVLAVTAKETAVVVVMLIFVFLEHQAVLEEHNIVLTTDINMQGMLLLYQVRE
jgi:hypothetical protein